MNTATRIANGETVRAPASTHGIPSARGLSPASLCLSFLLPVGIAIIQSRGQLGIVLGGGLLNPDSYMRLVRLQETLNAHRPMDIVLNDASGNGTLLHWSHLLDSLLAVLAAPFMLIQNEHNALHSAALLTGPLLLGTLGIAVTWAAAPFASARYPWLAAVLIAASPSIKGYALLGVVHHHVPVIITAVVGAGWVSRLIVRQAHENTGLALGAWAGLGVWLTPESVPLSILVFGGLWLAWILDPLRQDLALAIRHAGFSFLLIVTAAFAVDPPYAGYSAVEVDRISVLFLGFAAAIAAVAFETILLDRVTAIRSLSPLMRLGLGLVLGCIPLFVWIAAFPVVLRGTSAMLPSADWEAMFSHIGEMQRVRGTSPILLFLFTGFLGFALLVWLAIRHRSFLLAYAAGCALFLLFFGQQHVRFSAYPEAIAAVLLPVAIDTLESLVASRHEVGRMLARIAAMVVFLLTPYAGLIAGAKASNKPAPPVCKINEVRTLLRPYAGQVVLGNVNDTPALLYLTHVRTVGSLYHRNVAAFLRLRAAWRSTPGSEIPQAVEDTRASLILLCPEAGRSPLVSDLPPTTLLDELQAGRLPSWLQRVTSDRISGYTLYRILRP